MIHVEVVKAKKMTREEAEELKKECEAVLAYLKEFYFTEGS